ncbi:hypothetical protein GCM10011405_23960 [Rufibacter glacialis]|nr:hypothetical protein GCM10011405_23960 [Rufibacter glacialis]
MLPLVQQAQGLVPLALAQRVSLPQRGPQEPLLLPEREREPLPGLLPRVARAQQVSLLPGLQALLLLPVPLPAWPVGPQAPGLPEPQGLEPAWELVCLWHPTQSYPGF